MPKGKIGNWSSSLIGQRRYSALLMFGVRERFFLRILAALLFLTAVFYVNVQVAMWLGFLVASYSVVANDSIQTIGTFIVSNSDKKWYVLWLFIGLLFVGTVTYSWITYGGEIVALMPQISNAAKGAVADARLRGGNFSKAMAGA